MNSTKRNLIFRDNKYDITFVFPGYIRHPSGGYKMVYEYSNMLAEEGYKVAICFDCSNLSTQYSSLLIRKIISEFGTAYHPRWFKLDKRIDKKCVFGITDTEIPNSRCVIATAAITAKPVSDLSAKKGGKGYLIQGYETWFLDRDELEQTYSLGMTNIVVSQWLKNIVDNATNASSVYIPNPIDLTVFYPDQHINSKEPCLSVLYHEQPDKGFPYAWESIELAHSRIPDLKVEMFGAFEPPANLPTWVNYTKNATPIQLHSIYNKSSVYVCASINDGFGLTCVEAMACGNALVLSDFQGAKDYAENGSNALISPLRNPEKMADNIIELFENKKKRELLSKNAVATAKQFDKQSSLERLMNTIESISR